MKKLVLAVVLAVPLASYPIATWVLGKGVEATLAEQYKQLEAVPYMKVVQRDYQRGIYRSTDTVTFEVFGDLLKMQRDSGEQPPAKPIRFTVRSNIVHGPFPGWSSMAAAASDSELVLDDETRQALGKLMGDKQPLSVHTVYRFDGGGHSSISSPAFSATLPGEDGGSVTQLTWDGLKLMMDFSPHAARYTVKGGAPRLELRDGEGTRMVMSGLHLEADQVRLFEDEPLFYTGPARFLIDEVTVGAAQGQGEMVRIGKVAVEQDLKSVGEYVDFISRIGADAVQVGADNYGPVHYDVSLNHLHARSVARLYREVMALYANPAILQGDEAGDRVLAVMVEPGTELLKHNPEFSLDRISFMSPQGEARVAARVRFDDLRTEDFDNPMLLMTKLDASAEVELPEAMLMFAAMAGMSDEASEGVDADVAESMQPKDMLALLEALGEEGYLQRANGVVKVKARFANGQLSLNGKPFDPGALSGDVTAQGE